jgi:hypothetical protein
MQIYRQAAASSRIPGDAAPPPGTATEVYSGYIVVDNYAKVVQGMKAEDAVGWATRSARSTGGP